MLRRREVVLLRQLELLLWRVPKTKIFPRKRKFRKKGWTRDLVRSRRPYSISFFLPLFFFISRTLSTRFITFVGTTSLSPPPSFLFFVIARRYFQAHLYQADQNF